MENTKIENVGNSQIKISQTIPVMKFLQGLRNQASSMQKNIDIIEKQAADAIVDLRSQLNAFSDNINQVAEAFPEQP